MMESPRFQTLYHRPDVDITVSSLQNRLFATRFEAQSSCLPVSGHDALFQLNELQSISVFKLKFAHCSSRLAACRKSNAGRRFLVIF